MCGRKANAKIILPGTASRTEHGCRPVRRRTGKNFFAMALFFASKRWGDGAEPFNYPEQARSILRACVHKGEDGEGDPMWDLGTKLIKFIPETPFSHPSYHLPHFYELFALLADEQDSVFWKEAAARSRAFHPQRSDFFFSHYLRQQQFPQTAAQAFV